MAISDFLTASARRPRSVVRSRRTGAKLFSFTTRIAAIAILAAMATISVSTTSAQAQTVTLEPVRSSPSDSAPSVRDRDISETLNSTTHFTAQLRGFTGSLPGGTNGRVRLYLRVSERADGAGTSTGFTVPAPGNSGITSDQCAVATGNSPPDFCGVQANQFFLGHDVLDTPFVGLNTGRTVFRLDVLNRDFPASGSRDVTFSLITRADAAPNQRLSMNLFQVDFRNSNGDAAGNQVHTSGDATASSRIINYTVKSSTVTVNTGSLFRVTVDDAEADLVTATSRALAVNTGTIDLPEGTTGGTLTIVPNDPRDVIRRVNASTGALTGLDEDGSGGLNRTVRGTRTFTMGDIDDGDVVRVRIRPADGGSSDERQYGITLNVAEPVAPTAVLTATSGTDVALDGVAGTTFTIVMSDIDRSALSAPVRLRIDLDDAGGTADIGAGLPSFVAANNPQITAEDFTLAYDVAVSPTGVIVANSAFSTSDKTVTIGLREAYFGTPAAARTITFTLKAVTANATAQETIIPRILSVRSGGNDVVASTDIDNNGNSEDADTVFTIVAADLNDDSTLASAVVGADGETGTPLIFSGTPPTAATLSVDFTTRLLHVLTATDTTDTTGATIALCEVNDPSDGTGDPVQTGTGSFTWGSTLTSLRTGGGAGDYAFRVLVRSENAVDATPPNCDFLTNDQVDANPAITAYFYTVTVEPEETVASTDATLSDLEVDDADVAGFVPGTTAYPGITRVAGTAIIKVDATPTNAFGVVTSITGCQGGTTCSTGNPVLLTGSPLTDNTTPETEQTASFNNLATGANTIEVLVTAQSGAVETYTLTVTVAAAAVPTVDAVTYTGPARDGGDIRLLLNYSNHIAGSVTNNTPPVTHFIYVSSTGILGANGSLPSDCQDEDIAENTVIPIADLVSSCSSSPPVGEGFSARGAAGATITFRLRNSEGVSADAVMTFAAATPSVSSAEFVAYTATTGGTAIAETGPPLAIPVTEGATIYQRLTLNAPLGTGEEVTLFTDPPVAAVLLNANPDATIDDDVSSLPLGSYNITATQRAGAIPVGAATDNIVEGPEYFQIGVGNVSYTHALLGLTPANGILTYRIDDATTTNATVTLDATTVDEGGTLTATVTLDSDKMLAEAATFVLMRVDADGGSVDQAEDADVMSFGTVTVAANELGASGTGAVIIAANDGTDVVESFKVGIDLAASTYGGGRSLSDQITPVPSPDVAITDVADATVTITAASPTVGETVGEVEITVALTAPATQTITLPFTVGTESNAATIVTSGDDPTASFFPSNADYVLTSDDCTNRNVCRATGDDIVFEMGGPMTKTLTIKTRADGSGGEDTDETVTITLDEVTSGGITVPANTSATVTIESPDFDLRNPTNRRLEIGGASGSVTLRIRDFEFPAESVSTDILVVPVSLNQLFTPDGRAPSPNFPRTNNDARPKNADQGQEISGDFIRLSLDSGSLADANRPYFLAQNGSTVRLVVPQALLAENGSTDLSLGTPTVVGAEDIIININAIDNENAETGDFDWTMGIAGGAYPDSAVSTDGLVTFGDRRGGRFGALIPNDDTRIGYSIVRPLADPPLPRTLNPAAQNIVEITGTDDDDNLGGVVTVALPAVTAPPNAVSGEIVLDVTDTTATAAAVSALSLTGNTEISITAASGTGNFDLIAPAESRRNTRFAVPGGGVDDLSLSFSATPERTIYGTVAFRVIPRSALDDNASLTFEATGIIFRNSAGNEINAAGAEEAGFQMVVDDTIATGRTAKVTNISLAPNSVLGGLKVGEGVIPDFDGITLRSDQTFDVNFLSETGDPAGGTGVGVGVAKIPYVAANVGVAVEIEPGDPADFTTVGGTNADSGSLIPVPATTIANDRTVMVSGFTPGRNSLTIRVAEASDANPRDYTISVIVAPAPPRSDDSTLASATVNDVPVTLTLPTGAVDIPAATLATIVGMPTSPNATAFVCAAATGPFITAPTAVSTGNGNTFIIYVVADEETDGTAVTAPTTCDEAQADVGESNATATTITVNVLTVAANASDLTALSVTPGSGSEASVDDFGVNTLHYGVTLADGTTTAAITATARVSTATVAVTSVSRFTDPTDDPTDTDTGTTIAMTEATEGDCSGTGSIGAGCGIEGVDAGETAIVTIAVTNTTLVKTYTIAIGPASARLVLSAATIAPEAAVNLTVQLRNYDQVPDGGLASTKIVTNLAGLPSITRGDTIITATDFTLSVAAVTGIDADSGGFDMTSGGFRVTVPKALLDAGNNGSTGLVNGVSVPVVITANENARVGATTFAFEPVRARTSTHAPVGDATILADTDTTVHTLTVDADTVATLSFPGAATLGTDGAILAASGETVTARLEIKNPSGTADMRVVFRVRKGDAANAEAEYLTDRTVNNVVGADRGTITYQDSGVDEITITNDLGTVLDGVFQTGSDGEAGWIVEYDDSAVTTPIVVNVDITLGAAADTDGDLYTLEFKVADSQNIDTFVTPRSTGTLANRGRIEVGTFEQTITAGDIVTAVEGGGETASLPVTVSLAAIPVGETSVYYRLTRPAAANAHAIRGTDYTINCIRTSSPETCTQSLTNDSGAEFDADRDGSIADEAADSTGRLVLRAEGFAGTLSQTFTISIDAATDTFVEGPETVELTLFYPVAGDDSNTINSGLISVDITDANITTATVSLGGNPATVPEGADATAIVTLGAGTLAGETRFTLQREDSDAGEPEAEDDDFNDFSLATNQVVILAGGASASVGVGIVSGDGNDSPENFKLGIASIDDGARDLSGQFTTFVSTGDVQITPDVVGNSPDARLAATDGLTLGGNPPTNFEPGTAVPAPDALGGTITLAADVGSVVVVADPRSTTADITSIVGFPTATCLPADPTDPAVATVLGVTATTGVLGTDNATITATVGGTFGDPGALVTGENCIRVLVTAFSGDTQTYDVIATVPVSDNTSLLTSGGLSVGGVDAVINPLDSTAYTVSLDVNTDAGALAIAATNEGARISGLSDANKTGTVTLASIVQGVDNTAAADLTTISNADTITFTVTAANTSATEVYTLTFDIPNALLASVRLTPTAPAAAAFTETTAFTSSGTHPNNLAGEGVVSPVAMNTTGGTLLITPDDLEDTIVRVSGVNEGGGTLTGLDASIDADHGTVGARTLTVGNLQAPGSSTLSVAVRPENGNTNGADDRTYTIRVTVANATARAAPTARLEAIGATTLQEDTPSAMFNYILEGFDISGSVGQASMNLRFGGDRFVRNGLVFTNDTYTVTFPDTTRGDSFDVDEMGASVAMAGDIHFWTNDATFQDDGTIYLPITIGPATLGENFPAGTISIVTRGSGNLSAVRGHDGGSGANVTGPRNNVALADIAADDVSITYITATGPLVALARTDVDGTATEAAGANRDATFDLTIGDSVIPETRSPAGTAEVSFTLTSTSTPAAIAPASASDARADYTIAVVGKDGSTARTITYGATNTVTLAAADRGTTAGDDLGEFAATFTVTPRDDRIDDDNENVTLTITSVDFSGGDDDDDSHLATLTEAADLTIVDDDSPPAGVLSVADPAFLVEDTSSGTFDLTMTGIPNEILNTVPTPDALVDLDYLDVSLAFTAGGTGVDTSFTTVTNGATSVATDDFSLIASGAGVTFRPRASGEGFILRVPAELFDNNEGTPMTPGAETITFTVTSMDIDDVNLSRSALFTPDAVAWGTDDPAETPEAGPTFTENTTANFIIVAATSVCLRTAAVRDAIVAEVAGADCDTGTVASEPTTDQLGAITSLTVDGLSTSLLTADFAGLDDTLTTLNFTNGTFTDIPAGFFTNLTGLITLSFGNNTRLNITAGRLDDVPDSLMTLTIDSSYMATPSFAANSVGPLTGTASLTVELDQVLPVAVRIPFTSGTTTVIDDDTTGVIIPAGAMRNTVAVPILGSNSDMDTVDLTLGMPALVTVLNGVATDLNTASGVVGSLIATNSTAATITLREGPVVSLASTATATEAGPAAGNLLMTLTRVDTTVDEAADITFTIGTGGATRGADYALTITDSNGNVSYSAVAGGADNDFTFQLAADAMDATFVVTPVDDSNSEDDETVTITITAVNFPNLTTQPMMVTLPAAGVVTITDNDADAVLENFSPADLSIFEEDVATFDVVLSSAPDPGVETTITLTMTGAAFYGEGPDDDYTIMIGSESGTEVGTAADTGPGGTATTIVTPASGAATVTFYVVTEPNNEVEPNKTIIIALTRVTDNASTDYDVSQPDALTITIEEDDEPPANFCAENPSSAGRTQEVRAAILLKAGDSCDTGEAPTVAELRMITELDLNALGDSTGEEEITTLGANDLMNLDNVETLVLPLDDNTNEPSITAIADGALDPVLPTLTGANGLQNFPETLRDAVTVGVAAANADEGDGIQQGSMLEIEINRSNPFTAATVSYMVTGGFVVDPTASAANQSTFGTLAIAPNQDATGTLAFATGVPSRTLTISPVAEAGTMDTVRFMISGVDLDLITGNMDLERMLSRVGTDDTNLLNLGVTLPAVVPTLSPSSQSIGEKSGGTAVITLDLNIPAGATGYGTTTVTFEVDPFGEGVPSLAISGDGEGSPYMPSTPGATGDANVADYTLSVEHSDGTVVTEVELDDDLDDIASGDPFTFNIPDGGRMATFSFTAIDDERREDRETVNLTITDMNYDSGTTMDSPVNDPSPPAPASVTITEIGGEDIMRETQMIAHAVGKEQVNLITGLVRQRVSALTLGTPEGFSEPGVQLALAENPETMEDFFSQMALESSGEMDEGGAYAIWAKGQYIKISGSPDVTGMSNFEYDGKIAGIGMGMEKRFSESLVGLSMNFSTADIDSSSDVRTNANYKETMTFFAPYAAWKPNNSRLTLWGTAGAGFGSATVNADEHAEGNPSVQAFFAQGGVDISDNLGETAEFVFGMSAVAIEKTVDAWTAGTDSAPEAESSIFQAQADATAYFPVYSDDGQVLRPYVGLASVHDIGDVTNDDRHAMEVQTGIAWSNGPWQVSFDTFYQFLRDDEEAWGVFGEAQWSGTGDLDGLLMGVTSGHGTASSMSDAASSTDSVNSDIDTNLANADTETAEWSIQTTSEYGFAAPVVDRNGRATPFFRSTHSADARSFESGVRMDVTDNIGMTVETNRHIPADDDPYSEHAVGLEARWEF